MDQNPFIQKILLVDDVSEKELKWFPGKGNSTN